MNNKKKILIIILIAIVINLSIYTLGLVRSYANGTTSGENKRISLNITEEQLKNEYENVYSVDYLQELTSTEIDYNYESVALAKIRGEKVVFTDYETTREGNTCIENNIMAAIVSGASVEGTGYEHGVFYSGAQLAVWEFWNTWVENSNAQKNGFEKGSGNENVTVTEIEIDGQEQRKIAQQYATQEEYNVNIYFLKYFSQKNTHVSEILGVNIDNQPNLIFIEVLDEDGEVIEFEIEDSHFGISLTDNKNDIVNIDEEITYNIELYNEREEEQQDLKLISKLPKGVTFIDVVEIVDSDEIKLDYNVDYTYNEETRKLTVNIKQIDAATRGTDLNETTGENIEYIKTGYRKYKVTVKVNKLEDEVYIKEIRNVAEVQKGNKVLARDYNVNTISMTYLEIEAEKLQEKMNEEEQCVIGLKITNKGLIKAENVDVTIFIPEEISMSLYKIDILNENGDIEKTREGTTDNEFEKNSIEIDGQKTVYIQLIGTIGEIEETKQIVINGTVNNENVSWITNVQAEGGN